jgi:hypothetical protein
MRGVRGKSGGGQRWATFVNNHTVSSSDRVFNPLIAAAAVLATSSFFRSFIESRDHESTFADIPRFAVRPVTGGATLSLGGRF